MNYFIVDSTSGTYHAVQDCYLVDISKLTEEQLRQFVDCSDAERIPLAEETGKSLNAILASSGFGDMHYGNSIGYTPRSLRDEYSSYLESGMFDEGSNEEEMLRWALNDATDEELETIGELCMADDDAWKTYKTVAMSNLYYFKTTNLQ